MTNSCGDSTRVVRPGQPGEGGSSPTSPLQKSPRVERISLAAANTLLRHHYLGPVKSATVCFGHSEGCTVWGVPRSRAVHAKMRNAAFTLIELIRMVGVPGHKWATSSLLSHSIRCLFSSTTFDSAITYADREVFHTGAVYLAANWLPLEDAQPDGFLWRLDGLRVSRQRFYKSLGSSSLALVKERYGSRLVVIPDVPKKRFLLLKDRARTEEAKVVLKKVKTWGAARLKSHERSSRGPR